MEGWGWQAVHDPLTLPAVMARWKLSIASGQPFDMVFPLRGADGVYRPFLTRVNPLRGADGSLQYWFGTNTDISEQKQAEDALRQQARANEALYRVSRSLAAEHDLQKIVQTVTDEATALTDAQFGAFFYNAVGERGEEYTLFTISGMPREAFAEFPMPRNTAIFEPTFRGQRPVRLHDVTEDPRFGKNAPYQGLPPGHLPVRSYMAVPVASRTGAVLGGLFFAHEQPGVFNERHEHMVVSIAAQAAVAIDNARLYAELREADRRKDEFLATLAHELRNPLAPIRNSLEIMSSPAADAELLDRSRQTMARQMQHLVRLVDDLLDVSRVMRGKIELRKQRVSVAAIITHAVETAQPVIESQQHELMVEQPSLPPEVEVDELRIAQVLSNLLTNAAKYTPRGGRIWLSFSEEANWAVLRVSDTGIGIAREMLPKVFDLFMQVDNSVGRSQGGLGIGLTLVRSLIEMHGGQVEATSGGVGQGSEFIVKLPKAANTSSQEPAAQPSTLASAVASPKRRILVVDDNADAADSLAMLLKLKGNEVFVANDGATALALATERQPAIIILDLGMPVMDGYEVARRLRTEQTVNVAVLAALTGWGQEEDRRRSLEAGFDIHLVKPVDPAALDKLLNHPNLK
jgi:signal transduction histidine kinase